MGSNEKLFTARGRILVSIKNNPGITIRELAEGLNLTIRTIWGIIGELRDMGYLTSFRLGGRANHYEISAHGRRELQRLVD